jgi:hypothetical protein
MASLALISHGSIALGGLLTIDYIAENHVGLFAAGSYLANLSDGASSYSPIFVGFKLDLIDQRWLDLAISHSRTDGFIPRSELGAFAGLSRRFGTFHARLGYWAPGFSLEGVILLGLGFRIGD